MPETIQGSGRLGDAYLEDVFGAGGHFAKALSGYEPRAGQLELARAIDKAFDSETHLIAEGPCGTGKSVAYLVPAIHHAVTRGKKVLVATANIALQEQLVAKDLPMLAKVLPEPFRFALVKGKRNYLCPARLLEAGELGLVAGDPRHVESLVAWAERSSTGDISELAAAPRESLWSRACGSDGECDRHRCISTGCFVQRSRDAAKHAHVIVTNYHLFFADLTTVDERGKRFLLPEYDYVICDEGHEMAGCARAAFGFDIEEYTFERVAQDLEDEGEESLAETLRIEGSRFLAAARELAQSNRYRARLKARRFVDAATLQAAIGAAQAYWDARVGSLEGRAGHDRAKGRLKDVAKLGGQLAAVLELPAAGDAVWINVDRAGRVTISSQPVRVGELLRKELFAKVKSVVVTSATMTTAGTFDYLREEVGLEGGSELVVASPFDHRAQALLVIPEMKTEPSEPGFREEMEARLREVLDVVGGSTLGLFTSHDGVKHARDTLASSGHRLLVQNEGNRSWLLQQFRDDVASVLLATQSFWVGVDVPGDALRCVTIDKLPFSPPDDPILDALAEKEPRWFRRYALPRAIWKLRQGAGRLIRSLSDYGVLVIFDKRVITRSYGPTILESLPPMRLERRLTAIPEFLEGRRAA